MAVPITIYVSEDLHTKLNQAAVANGFPNIQSQIVGEMKDRIKGFMLDQLASTEQAGVEARRAAALAQIDEQIDDITVEDPNAE
jgi:hypothetical protein